MAEGGESWFVKLGVLFDGTGFKKFGIAAFDVKKTVSGLADSFKRITATNADLFSSARYLSMSTDRLQIWERAFGLIGGSAEDARSAINSLNFAFDKLRLGQGGEMATLAARLKLRPEDLTSFETMIEALNRSYNTYYKDNYGQFKVLAEQMGLSKSAILLVTQSVKEYQRTIRRAGSVPLINERQLKAFHSLQSRFFLFTKRFELFKAQAAGTFAPSFDRILGRIEDLMKDPKFNKALDNAFNAFEKMFDEMARTENIEAFIKVTQAAVDVLTALVNVASKIPDAMGWVGDKLGTVVGAGANYLDKRMMQVRENIEKDPLTKAGVFNPLAAFSLPTFKVNPVAGLSRNNQTSINIYQENSFNGNADDDAADTIASRTAGAVKSQAAKRDIDDMRAITAQ
nr:MAG TPA: tail tape measure [Bacteriophage sp.]